MEAVRIEINEGNLIGYLRNAFTSKFTYIAELMQNARRAGASKVEITYDEEKQRLTVSDDGCGISDMQALFSVAESGWGEDVQSAEPPYGVGFLSALFQSESVRIHSGCTELAFDTESALGLKYLPTETVEVEVKGTVVELNGVRHGDPAAAIREYANGYALPVTYNGVAMTRAHALDVLDKKFVRALPGVGVGYIRHIALPLGPETENASGTKEFVLYLQGIKVYGTSRHLDYGNVIHLDPKLYMGRAPDRDKLIDQDEVVKKVEESIAKIWQWRIDELLVTTPGKYLAKYGFEILEKWGRLDALCGIDYVPNKLLVRYEGYPIHLHDFEDDDVFACVSEIISRREVESGAKPIIRLPEDRQYSGVPFEDSMYAHAKGLVCLRREEPYGHWLADAAIGLSGLSVRPEGDLMKVTYSSSNLTVPVIICDRLFIDGPLGTVEIEETFFGALDGVRHVFSPRREHSVMGRVVRQISDFNDEMGFFDEDAANDEESNFDRFLVSCRADKAEDLLGGLLDNIQEQLNGMPTLHGKTFSIAFDEFGNYSVKESASGEN